MLDRELQNCSPRGSARDCASSCHCEITKNSPCEKADVAILRRLLSRQPTKLNRSPRIQSSHSLKHGSPCVTLKSHSTYILYMTNDDDLIASRCVILAIRHLVSSRHAAQFSKLGHCARPAMTICSIHRQDREIHRS